MQSAVHTARQEVIDRHRARLMATYPARWARMCAEFRHASTKDQVWLTYAASYLFSTGGVHWAVDPVTLRARVPEAPAVELPAALSDLSFVLLTHGHGGHADHALWRALAPLPVCWVVPEFLLDAFVEVTHCRRDHVIVPQAMRPFEISNVRITPYPGAHRRGRPRGAQHGPRMAYLVETGRRRILLPGDVRCFEAALPAGMAPVDVVFAHVWLGKGRALEARPPLLGSFCDFFLSFAPRRIFLTHLHELGRGPADYWDERHAMLVARRLAEAAPAVDTRVPEIGEGLSL